MKRDMSTDVNLVDHNQLGDYETTCGEWVSYKVMKSGAIVDA